MEQIIVRAGINFLVVAETENTVTLRRVTKSGMANGFYPFDLEITRDYFNSTENIGASIFVDVKDHVLQCVRTSAPIGALVRTGLVAILPHFNVREIVTISRTKKVGSVLNTTAQERASVFASIEAHNKKLAFLQEKLAELDEKIAIDDAQAQAQAKIADQELLATLLEKLGLSLAEPSAKPKKPSAKKPSA